MFSAPGIQHNFVEWAQSCHRAFLPTSRVPVKCELRNKQIKNNVFHTISFVFRLCIQQVCLQWATTAHRSADANAATSNHLEQFYIEIMWLVHVTVKPQWKWNPGFDFATCKVTSTESLAFFHKLIGARNKCRFTASGFTFSCMEEFCSESPNYLNLATSRSLNKANANLLQIIEITMM